MIEVRSQLPPAQINAIWPAAWIIAASNNRDQGPKCWPVSQEADIYEAQSVLSTGRTAACASIHWGTECNVDRGDKYGCVPHPENFNVWAIRWSKKNGGSITWYLNGVEFFRETKATSAAPLPLSEPMAMIMNTAIVENAGEPGVGVEGVEHLFDWIRVWEEDSVDLPQQQAYSGDRK